MVHTAPVHRIGAGRDRRHRFMPIQPPARGRQTRTIGATTYYTLQTNGLAHDWPGRVWMNPPYGGQQVEFIARLMSQLAEGITEQAVVLVNANGTETQWFKPLWEYLLCFADHRINFLKSESGLGCGATHGSVFIYLGPNQDAFVQEFSRWDMWSRRWEGDHPRSHKFLAGAWDWAAFDGCFGTTRLPAARRLGLKTVPVTSSTSRPRRPAS